MAPSKLSESDKKEILELYRQPGETTANIASRFDVSTATISRILKQGLPEGEYEVLIQQKRGLTIKGVDESLTDEVAPEPVEPVELIEPVVVVEPVVVEPVVVEPVKQPLVIHDRPSPPEKPKRRQPLPAITQPSEELTQLSLTSFAEEHGLPRPEPITAAEPAVMAQEIYQEELTHPADFDEDLEEEDDLDDDLDDDFDDDDDDDDLAADGSSLLGTPTVNVHGEAMIKVLPLEQAIIPKTFYLVVDRASELITRPLKDFAELGQIPEEEVQEKTLPIFDNHRVAKRFLRKMQRVIKVPDGRVLPKVSTYLQARGITRLLIDGQIYSL
jgi:transposase-like protein